MTRQEAITILRERIYRYKDLEDITGIIQEDVAIDLLISQLDAAHATCADLVKLIISTKHTLNTLVEWLNAQLGIRYAPPASKNEEQNNG